ncbi:MAG: hypothetical protein A2745_02305 [Candidatus Harrisonbacteria bacterium RIFCSPHIGHO2_01_FULL_44_13]|uniref:Small-conductance mechanosensitive ion channel n=1 Tax=Candidatus Harrisonbacteria bacterium RIFCSPLOWO2_01_FULL_44_18 TaxID=1798407 RepID=A0A1G1ZNL9_9BACT|nr:MAG: hypothetical protein A2745_02305 [Candidatus Harrisonbacteria bacterium RIFCSPHIGHO2_01_FULL_44_13]OGY66162.1 MAG: hypothetical protein A3A16_02570 [Candidatus Harrisonbacteria bacterium RIFCSPLOWO2_01_FULL_44_18]
MVVQNWVDVLVSSLQDLWLQVVGFVPELLGALVVFLVGLVVAAVLERVVERLIYYLKLDALLRRLGVEAYLQRANLQLNAGHFLGQVVYWFMLIAFLLAASDILGFFALSDFLREVLLYIPKVVVAALILLATLVLANFLRHLIRATIQTAKLHGAKALGTVTWWVVFVFGLLTALVQLGIAVSVINTLITGLIAMLALAGGLAFGLGGRDYAARLLEKLRAETEHHTS